MSYSCCTKASKADLDTGSPCPPPPPRERESDDRALLHSLLLAAPGPCGRGRLTQSSVSHKKKHTTSSPQSSRRESCRSCHVIVYSFAPRLACGQALPKSFTVRAPEELHDAQVPVQTRPLCGRTPISCGACSPHGCIAPGRPRRCCDMPPR